MPNDNLEKEYLEMKSKRRRVILLIIFVVIFISLLTGLIIEYYVNFDFRKIIDVNVFNKMVDVSSLKSVSYDNEESSFFTYQNSLGIVSNDKLELYNLQGIKDKTFDIDLQNPLISTNNRFLAIASKNGKIVYVFENKELINTLTIEGQVKKIVINQNGFLAVCVDDNIYKSSLEFYDNYSKLVFKKYFSDEIISHICINNTNDKIAIASLINSRINSNSKLTVLEVQKLKEERNSYVAQSVEFENNLIFNINYCSDGEINFVTKTFIGKFDNGEVEQIVDFETDEIDCFDIDLDNCITYVTSENGFQCLVVENTKTLKKYKYILDSSVKEIVSSEKRIALNLGDELDVFDRTALLIKSFRTNEEIRNIKINDEFICFESSNVIYFSKI